jgi:uroporphyrinogen-III decarboxylase
VDIDSAVSVADAREKMGPGQVLLGGIDPVRVLLTGTPDDVAEAVRRCRDEAGPRYILGAGCEVPRGTPDANLLALAACA